MERTHYVVFESHIRVEMKAARPCFLHRPSRILPSSLSHFHRICTSKFSALVSSMASAGWICQGEGGRRYRLVRPLGTPVRGGKGCNVWLGLDDSKPDAEYIMKRPPAEQSEESWPGALSAFKHELEMQRLFAKDPMIRRLVDYVPESETSGPMMVLEAFTDSLWDARNVRPFTTKEIKWIMKGVLLGIFTVHMKGLVHTGKNKHHRDPTHSNRKLTMACFKI